MRCERYFMPPEWRQHDRCWMAWPCDEDQWINGLDKARFAFSEVAHAIADFEPVTMVCRAQDEANARHYLSERIDLTTMALDDSWIRDSGPTFVFDEKGKKWGVDWKFNGWGKFPHQHDQWVAQRVLECIGAPRIDSALFNEGGAIHVDGEGSVLLTESVLLNVNRNPNWNKREVETELARTLGISNCVWLPRGLVDDDTDGHIDELACFVAPGNILALVTSDQADDNFPILQNNLEILAHAENAQGNPFQVTAIEQPPARYLDAVRLSMSYVNFYIANGGIVMPSYGFSDYDEEARSVVQRCFPEREVRQIDSLEIVQAGGNIHCITQQEPQERRRS